MAGRNARTDGLTTADYRTLAELRYLLRRFAAFSEAAARRAGLTSQQHQALLAIKGFPGRERLAVGELAERLQLRPPQRRGAGRPAGGARAAGAPPRSRATAGASWWS